MISIIIPTYNEAQIVEEQLSKLLNRIDSYCEVILVDAGEDNTSIIASKFDVNIIKSPKGRAVQMNNGAKHAKGKLLYFLHLDTDVVDNFNTIISERFSAGVESGCFQMEFDDKHWLMRFYGWCTRLSFSFCRGGDQSLFITKSLFNNIGGFDTSLTVMEDIEIINRIKQKGRFEILPQKVITSARKYVVNGRVRLQLIFGLIHLMYNLGFSQQRIVSFYKNNIRKS